MGAVGAGIGAAATAVEAAPIIGGVAANIATVAGTTAGATAVGTIATTGAVGAANAASGVNKRKVAEGIKSVSMMNYDAERKKLETTQDETNKRLAELGQLKLKAWGEGYPRFCEMYSKVKLPPNSNGEVALEGDLSITPEDLSEFDQPAYKFLHSFKGVVQLDLLWQLHWQERKDFDFFLFHCVSPNKNRTIHADCPAKSKGERPKTLPSR